MVKLTRIYTRTGDDGSTGLADGTLVNAPVWRPGQGRLLRHYIANALRRVGPGENHYAPHTQC